VDLVEGELAVDPVDGDDERRDEPLVGREPEVGEFGLGRRAPIAARGGDVRRDGRISEKLGVLSEKGHASRASRTARAITRPSGSGTPLARTTQKPSASNAWSSRPMPGKRLRTSMSFPHAQRLAPEREERPGARLVWSGGLRPAARAQDRDIT